MGAGMSEEEIEHARRQVVMDLTIAEAEERRAEVLAADLAVALRKADEAMRRAQTMRAMLQEAGAEGPDLPAPD